MELKIMKFHFGCICGEPVFGWAIQIKRHWWSKWQFRDWYDRFHNIPMFYQSKEEARRNL